MAMYHETSQLENFLKDLRELMGFPCAFYQSYGVGDSTLNYIVPNNNFTFNTKFFSDSEKTKYLHFTSTSNAINILDSKTLWMSNVCDFDDPMEFLLGAQKVVNWDRYELELIKQSLFVLSLTECNNYPSNSQYDYLWEKYSDKNSGVSFQFRFSRIFKPEIHRSVQFDPCLHPFYYLTKVSYIKSKDELFETVRDLLIKYPNRSFFTYFIPLLAAYKRKSNGMERYVDEMETRLTFLNLIDDLDMQHDIERNNYDHLNGNTDDFFLHRIKESQELKRTLPFSFKNEPEKFLVLEKVFLGRDFDRESETGNRFLKLCDGLNLNCVSIK